VGKRLAWRRLSSLAREAAGGCTLRDGARPIADGGGAALIRLEEGENRVGMLGRVSRLDQKPAGPVSGDDGFSRGAFVKYKRKGILRHRAQPGWLG
jgi:hypothetical protein